MLDDFVKHIERNFPFLGESKLILACSGGVDSITLANLLHQSQISFDLAHCNFGLRGAESDGDEAFVRALANQFGCHVFVKSFDMTLKKGSIQLAARNLRYEWFHDLKNSHKYDFILTAHHADDDLETFLINLSRGTGIEGLTGIPFQNEHVLRPMLPFSRNAIAKYAKVSELQWREDSSNAENKYLRNTIRHNIIPTLKELHPMFLRNFKKTQKHLKGISELLIAYQKNIEQKISEKEGEILKINAEELRKTTPLDPVLFLLFKEYGFTEISNLKELLNASSGKQLFSKTHRLIKDRGFLFLERITGNEKKVFCITKQQCEVKIPICLTITKVGAIGEKSTNTIYVDKETLKYPLLIRKWKHGDYFYPFGMKGKKKVAKFFKDEKVDVLSKEKQWLLCSDNQIVWVVGRRADNRFKVTPKTKNILKFAVQK